MIRTIEERIVYESAFATVFDDTVEFPDGHRGTYFRTRWKAPHGVAIVPVIGSEILLVELYRYSDRSWSVEIPQGFGTAGSTPLADAQRELHEETGLIAEELTPLLQFGLDYVTHAFTAHIAADATPNVAGIERTEAMRGFHRVPIANVDLALITSLGIRDPHTIACMLALRSLS